MLVTPDIKQWMGKISGALSHAGKNPRHRAAVRTLGYYPRLGSLKMSGRDHLQGPGQLLHALYGANAPANVLKVCHVSMPLESRAVLSQPTASRAYATSIRSRSSVCRDGRLPLSFLSRRGNRSRSFGAEPVFKLGEGSFEFLLQGIIQGFAL